MSKQTVSITKKDHIARITLRHPELDAVMDAELAAACVGINDDDDIYTVVITGSGNTFCCGAEKGRENDFQSIDAVAAIDRPVIAAVNGDALAEGLELALSCDIRITADNARFSLPEVQQGRLPTCGGTQRLPRIIGRGKALEMLLLGESMNAAQALEAGLVSRVVAAASLAEETQKLAETIAARGPVALRYLKEAVLKGMDLTLEQGLRLEADLYFLLHTTADRTEGINAFREKRKPDFKGK
jgi:enoyl-CoA hydratase/carnithine racemase